jgi:hypothetical protein
MKVGHIFCCSIALAAQAVPAPATIIHKAYGFQAANLGGPTAAHAGSFAFSYDDMTGETVLTMIDFAVGRTPFGAFNASVAPHAFHWTRPQFILGGVRQNYAENAIVHGTDDFWLIFRADPDSASQFAYSQAGTGFHYTTDVSLSAPPVEIPEPPAWPLLALATLLLFGGLVLSARMRADLRRH